MSIINAFHENPFLFLGKINIDILKELNKIDKNKSRSYKIYYGKRIINKILKEREVMEKIINRFPQKKYNNQIFNKIENSIIKNSIIKDILTDKEVKMIEKYFLSGILFSFSGFQNIIFYMEKIIRHLYLRVKTTSANHVGNQVLHYGELSNLMRKYDSNNTLNLYFSCLMFSEGFNIRNKIIHGEYTDEYNFKYEMFILLLMTEIVINIYEVQDEKKEKSNYIYSSRVYNIDREM